MKTSAKIETNNLKNQEEQIMKTSKRIYKALVTLTFVVLTVVAFGQNKEQLVNNYDLPQLDIVHSDANKQGIEDPTDHPVRNPIHIMDGYSNSDTELAGNSNQTMSVAGQEKMKSKSVLDGVSAANFHNYPNPFEKQTTIEFEVMRTSYVHLRISYRGQLVKIVASDFHDAGKYRVVFEAEGLPPGTYHASLVANGQEISNSMYKVR